MPATNITTSTSTFGPQPSRGTLRFPDGTLPSIGVIWHEDRGAYELHCHLSIAPNRARYYTAFCTDLNDFFSHWVMYPEETAKEIFGYEGWEYEYTPKPQAERKPAPRTIDDLFNL